MLTTYQDIVAHLMSYMRDNNATNARPFAKRAVADALREMANIHRWNYYRTVGRLSTSASYPTGTVAYTHTGGAYERQLTLSDGTFPLWIADGCVIIDTVPYDVSERKSDTVVTLSALSNPGADVASGTSYTAYRDTYPTPVDFVDIERVLVLDRDTELCYVSPSDWLSYQRYYSQPTNVWYYTIMGDPNYQGSMSFRLAGAPSSAETIDFIYRRRPRPLRYYEYNTGTVSVTADSATVTGSGGTVFSEFMVGSVIRFYDPTNYPTNEDGDYPAYVERTIINVSSTTVLTVDAVVPDTYTNVKYVISDPIDIDKQSMLNAFKRTAEKLIEQSRQGKNLASVVEMWRQDIRMAIGADKRYAGIAVAGQGQPPYSSGNLGDDAIVEFG